MDQHVVSLSTAESELYAADKTESEGLGSTAMMCLVNRRGVGKAEHVDMQNLWIQEASKSRRLEESGYEREARQLNDESTTRTENRAVDENHGL